MQFLGYTIETPLFLAPMAGVTDYAFRCICAERGAAVTVTEMVSSRALLYQDRKSLTLLRKTEGSLCGAQIFGNEPEAMARAAVLAIAHSGCDFLDINMGCPMPKIVNNGDGCALMRDMALAGRIVRAVKDAVSVPVTVKMRLGWDKGSINAVPFAQVLQDNGVDAITVHGRTRSMLYSGKADWDAIGSVVAAVSVPVIANGDLFTAEDILRCRSHSGAAFFMVGRAAFGDPWIFGELTAALRGNPSPARPPLSERMELAQEQFALAMRDKGEYIACLEARKQLAWYLRGVAYANFYKEEISHLSTADEVAAVVHKIQRDLR